MLEVPMTQPSAKANRAERTPASEEAQTKNGNNRSDSDFEAAYASNDNAEKRTGAEKAAENNIAGESPAAAKETPEVQTEDAEAFAAIDAETEVEKDLPADVKKDPADQSSEIDKPIPKTRAETSELAFAQRVLKEGSGTTTNEPTPTKAVPGEAQAIGQKTGTTHSMKAEPALPMEAHDKPPAQQISGKPSEQVNATPGAAEGKHVQTASNAGPETVIPSTKPERETIAQRRKLQDNAAEESLRTPRETAAAPRTKPQTSVVQTAIQNAVQQAATPLTVQSDPSGLDIPISALGEVDGPSAWDPRSTTPASLTQALSRPETPGMIGRQMAEALQRFPDRPVELSLNPEELGRVRLSIAAGEGGITVHVLAERPETLDLMRRHIDQLAREFQALGYESINFAFNEGQSDQNAGTDGEGNAPHASQSDADEMVAQTATPITLVPSSGVDLRL